MADAQPSDACSRASGGRFSKKPELNALEEQVGPANQSLKIAEANYRAGAGEYSVSALVSVSNGQCRAVDQPKPDFGQQSDGAEGMQYGLFHFADQRIV